MRKLELGGVLLGDPLSVLLVVVLDRCAKKWSISHGIGSDESLLIRTVGLHLIVVAELEVAFASWPVVHFDGGFGTLRSKLSCVLTHRSSNSILLESRISLIVVHLLVVHLKL